MKEEDFIVDDLLGTGEELENRHMPDARSFRLSARRRYENMLKGQQLAQAMPEPPLTGESVHVISNGRYDFWTWVPQMLGWIGRADELYCSTWTLCRANAVELFAVWDRGLIAPTAVAFLTGLYFKRRETAVYAMLLEGIRSRLGRYVAFENHAKVLLLANAAAGVWLTVEGSANLNSNPRFEQYVLTNDRGLYQFHRAWMEEALDTRDTKDHHGQETR